MTFTIPPKTVLAMEAAHPRRHRRGWLRIGPSPEVRSGRGMAARLAPKAIPVGIVQSDDNRRRFLEILIQATPGLAVAAVCDSGGGLSCFPRRPPEVCLASLFLEDMTGIDFLSRARKLWPSMDFIVLLPAQAIHTNQAFEILESGAKGYLPSLCSPPEVIDAIWTVHAGAAVLPKSFANIVTTYFRARGSVISRLTHREREVLRCLSRGQSRIQVARELAIGLATVERHIHNLLLRLEVHSCAEGVSRYLNPPLP